MMRRLRKSLIAYALMMSAGCVCMAPEALSFSECARTGDLMSDVVANCGEPSEIGVGEKAQLNQFFAPYHVRDGWLRQAPLIGEVPVDVEDWVYNYGRLRFMYTLRFENGILKSINRTGYGY